MFSSMDVMASFASRDDTSPQTRSLFVCTIPPIAVIELGETHIVSLELLSL